MKGKNLAKFKAINTMLPMNARPSLNSKELNYSDQMKNRKTVPLKDHKTPQTAGKQTLSLNISTRVS